MIRVLLFLRAWHAELRLWKHGLRHMLHESGSLSDDELWRMAERVDKYWLDFSTGYINFK